MAAFYRDPLHFGPRPGAQHTAARIITIDSLEYISDDDWGLKVRGDVEYCISGNLYVDRLQEPHTCQPTRRPLLREA